MRHLSEEAREALHKSVSLLIERFENWYGNDSLDPGEPVSFKIAMDVQFIDRIYADTVFRSKTLQFCERQEGGLFVDHDWEITNQAYDDTFFSCGLCHMKTAQRRGTPARTVEECQRQGIRPCVGVPSVYEVSSPKL
jgi:hypothetical protein